MYYLENKGALKGLLILKESEMVYKLSLSIDKALQFKSRYRANKYKKQNNISNDFRIIKINEQKLFKL
jgi:Tfp pilus assembly pilus retraction ATPase PilT